MEFNDIETQSQSQSHTEIEIEIEIQKSTKKNQSLQLVRLSINEHLEDFWEFWKEERGVVWSTKGTQKTRGEALELMKFILPKTKDNPEGETEESDKFAIVLRVEGDAEGRFNGVSEDILGDRRSHIPHLVAKVDPRNKASERIAMKAGARKGELLEKYYSRRIDEGKKSDAWCWYFDRPRSSSDERGNMVKDGKQEFSHA